MKRKKIVISIAMALGLTQQPSFAQFDSAFELSDLNGTNGFIINGIEANDLSGRAVSTAGDINSDGIDDFIIGANGADPNGNSLAGSSYVVFGNDGGFPSPFNLSLLDGSNGFVINGVAESDFSGRSVSAAGDVNGDDIDDLVIGANGADPNGNIGAGSSYVVFGSDVGFSSPFNLSSIDGINGFIINGAVANDRAGRAVSGAGDVNGDGIDDIIIGAYRAAPGSNSLAGSSYVIFGSDSALPNPFNLATINGTNGFVINGVATNDLSGRAVSYAGDVNGDGIDDLVIGAYGADPGGNADAGSSYVVFGNDGGFSSPFNLSAIDGFNGFIINGVSAGDASGISVGAAGDVNGDGIDDLVIGATDADPDGNNLAGSSYVVFGSTSGLTNPFELASIDGLNGFTLNGVSAIDESGISVSAAGDVNYDGIDDLIIGAFRADPGGNSSSGSSYVVFGSDGGFSNPFNLSTLNGLNGFVLNGAAVGDRSGYSVSCAGDTNGDGIDDLLIGAFNANPDGNIDAGSSYVVFGSDVIFKDGFE